ncbi:Flagellar basal-body rod protein FlgC [Buchnera aphidicola (Eriosoma lanigerum)]|uniref:flagellar basal body rod protein FlgC n=1 Tax=Buchnera aphidicola TaxID=9 RepID=UPI00346400A3
MNLFNVLDIASSGLDVQSKKINMNATNIANVDSMIIKNKKMYPYVAKKILLKFDNNKNIGGVKIDKIIPDSASFNLLYNPNNPMSDKNGYVKTSNVNVVSEIIDSISASRNYQANIEMINTIKLLLIKTLSMGQ